MGKRDQLKAVLRIRCLAVLKDKPTASAMEIARALGLPHQPVSAMLRTLQMTGEVEAEIITVKTKNRNGGEQRKLYRVRSSVGGLFPGWLQPAVTLPVGNVRLVKGRAGFLKRR
jgi:predicted transcriptional regulator